MLDTTKPSISAAAAYDAAIDNRIEARKTRQEAAEAVSRGEIALADAAAALARLSGVTDALAQHRAIAIRKGGRADAPLPAALKARRQERHEAEQLVDEVRAAGDELAAELAKAERELAEIERDVWRTARELFAEEIGATVDRYEELERQALPLRRELQAFMEAFAVFSPSSAGRPDAMPPAICKRVKDAVTRAATVPYEVPAIVQARREAMQKRLIRLATARP